MLSRGPGTRAELDQGHEGRGEEETRNVSMFQRENQHDFLIGDEEKGKIPDKAQNACFYNIIMQKVSLST